MNSQKFRFAEMMRAKTYWKTLGLDILFWISSMILAAIFNFMAILLSEIRLILFISAALYLFTLLAIYTFFKFRCLSIITEVKHGPKTGKALFFRFFLLNISLFGSLTLVIALIYYSITSLVKTEYQPIYLALAMMIILVIFYTFMNLAQFLTFRNKASLHAFPVLKSNILRFLLIYFIELIIVIALYIIYLILFNIPNAAFIINPAFQLVTLISLFLFNAHNRIIFYNSIRQS
jgi:hypothetical protein